MNTNTESLQSKYKTDLLMWGGVLAVSAVIIGIFMIFTTTSPIDLIKKILSAILIMLLPGYVIVKLYLDDWKLTENPAVDKFILSFGLSMVTVQSLAFLVNYFTIHAADVDQELRIKLENWVPVIIVALVIGIAVGLKFFWPKLTDIWNRLSAWFQAKLGDIGPTLLLILTVFLTLALLFGLIQLILMIVIPTDIRTT